MESNVWQNELKEIISFKASYEIESQKVLKELECLVDAQNDEVALLYTRRTLEVIITELCDDKWKKERGSEPLLSIIDRLHRDKFLPDFAHASMQNLNKIATFGVHPKEFDTNQVRTALLELVTVLKWYVKEKNYKKTNEIAKNTEKKAVIDDKVDEATKSTSKIIQPTAQTSTTSSTKNHRLLIFSSIILFLAIAIFLIFKLIPEKNTAKNINDTLNKQFTSKENKADTSKKTTLKINDVTTQEPTGKASKASTTPKNKQVSLVKEETKAQTSQNKPVSNESIEDLFKKFSYGTPTEKKGAVAGILAQCETNAKVSIMIGDNIVDEKPIGEYIKSKLLQTKYSFTIKKTKANSSGKITNLYISQEEK